MMGTKVRTFAPLPHDVSLEEMVPEDHFYRRLEATLDLSFVRELVGPLYARGGRPSVDPVVFFKLQLVMFFEELRSERQLMRAVAFGRLSVRWYLGYDLFEPLSDHSSLTRIRERFGLGVFTIEDFVYDAEKDLYTCPAGPLEKEPLLLSEQGYRGKRRSGAEC